MNFLRTSIGNGLWLSLCLMAMPVAALEFSDIASEGEIKFLKERPDPGAYSFQSRVKITPLSLENGSVDIATCHIQLDPIRKIVIVFNPERVQAIAVKSISKVASAEIKGNQVTLTDVERGANVCIDLRSRALDKIADSTYQLNAGPLMRRYFDGYLPMSAQLRVDWPKDMFAVQSTLPEQKEGVQVLEGNDGMQLDVTFAGKMTAQIVLKKIN
ncbi:hypothetical protein ICN41_11055 [Polynucleobacter sp. 15G-AUS-farblos]|uniref:hypothetical protein n=1 Tax=Polynucleobacter sp. 15G-AUS-farblos TaxID=2689094 RepID=UPI001C0D2E0E|nr:hypothetical protein [Polynucleobacter sp. 15G-AUS-farblos]MBU3584524.1 hypothetical protein [Polynucleobacter sp. 15G-AUS-farblos]